MVTWVYRRNAPLSELRHRVLDWGEHCNVRSPDDLALVITELVTNAVLHAETDLVAVHVRVDGDEVSVGVDDASSAPPVQAGRHPAAENGRGLIVVDALCSRWGWTARPTGKRVWCRVR